ncbi:hypothetical protein K469DRAFT_717837 [Zopfia rhizophila CBS 207.26]|uniref:FAD-binding FR-type domain-containing protein n=1 Tax=Zopfia rhizophila CBS 207.26 TaxID=1314779 RepID=A0A6A6DIA4_9PEZI|nr:hypothetical protein K469DRAFT_717837 [Zopfia rhizophila CBS 207.26]
MDGIPLSWAQVLLKFSLSATASSSYSALSNATNSSPISANADTGRPDRRNEQRFKEIVEAILFSRRFTLSYNVVLLGILVLFAIWHRGEKAVFARRRRAWMIREKREDVKGIDTRNAEDEVWSSSSSTVEGTITPPDPRKKIDEGNERKPLLPGRKRKARVGTWRPYYALKSWMLYQPRPIPIVNKTLPPNETSLLVLAFIGLNVFYNFYRMPLSLDMLFVFADRCGLMPVANLPLLYLLAAKNQPIKFLTGYSYEALNIFHRRVGELICFEALLHSAGFMVVWYTLFRHVGYTLVKFILTRLIGLGLLAFVAYQVLFFTSLGSFRQKCYELFLALHVFLQISGLALLWFHHYDTRPYVGISLAIFVIDRLIFRLWLKTSSHPATLTVLEDNETILLSSNWDISAPRAGLSNSTKAGWKPMDHVFLTIPSLSNSATLQSHPFTIFSGSPEAYSSEDTPHAWLTLLIRPQTNGSFTRTLLDYARRNSKTRVRLDGPYGSSHALDILASSENSIVVAGGSGIAVAYPLLWALLHRNSNSSDTDPGIDIEFGNTQLNTKQKVKLLWITHSASHRFWLPEGKLQELQSWGLEVLVAPPTIEAGRPDVRSILRNWSGGEKTGVVVSGPDALVRDVRNVCAEMVGRGERVRVQVEKFGW